MLSVFLLLISILTSKKHNKQHGSPLRWSHVKLRYCVNQFRYSQGVEIRLTHSKPLGGCFLTCVHIWARDLLTYSLSLILPSGLALRAAALEGGSLPGEPDALGKPLHDPPLPEPLPGRTRRHLRAGEQRRAAAPQREAVAPDAHLPRPATGERGGTCFYDANMLNSLLSS